MLRKNTCYTIKGREATDNVKKFFESNKNASIGKEIGEIFALKVISKNISEWKMKWDFETGWCDKSTKTLYIPCWVTIMGHWEIKEYVLHEVAHALDNVSMYDEQHGASFYEHFISLIQYYMIDHFSR